MTTLEKVKLEVTMLWKLTENPVSSALTDIRTDLEKVDIELSDILLEERNKNMEYWAKVTDGLPLYFQVNDKKYMLVSSQIFTFPSDARVIQFTRNDKK